MSLAAAGASALPREEWALPPGGSPRGADGSRLAARVGMLRVMTTRDEPVLICFDGSPAAEHAIDAAAALLGPRKAVVLNLAPVMTLAEMVVPASSVVPGSAFEELNRADVRRQARIGTAYARRAGFEAEHWTEIASASWQAIVAVADELDAAAIVIGSRGLSGLRERALGSVSHGVASHAGRPVLIAPPSRDSGIRQRRRRER